MEEIRSPLEPPEASKVTRGTSGGSDNGPVVDPVRELLRLVRELEPFLDTQGRAYCRRPSTAGPGVLGKIESEEVLSLLSYRYYGLHDRVPSRSELAQAVLLARGDLWHNCPDVAGSNPCWVATMEAVALAAEQSGDFSGSASQALKELKLATKQRPEINAALPDGETRLGIVLGRIMVPIRRFDVELSRPPRRDVKRLWSWRKLHASDDASDTSDTKAQDASGGAICRKAPGNDTSDRSSPSERAARREAIYRGGTTHDCNGH